MRKRAKEVEWALPHVGAFRELLSIVTTVLHTLYLPHDTSPHAPRISSDECDQRIHGSPPGVGLGGGVRRPAWRKFPIAVSSGEQVTTAPRLRPLPRTPYIVQERHETQPYGERERRCIPVRFVSFRLIPPSPRASSSKEPRSGYGYPSLL